VWGEQEESVVLILDLNESVLEGPPGLRVLRHDDKDLIWSAWHTAVLEFDGRDGTVVMEAAGIVRCG
jgi:hypothetical protein